MRDYWGKVAIPVDKDGCVTTADLKAHIAKGIEHNLIWASDIAKMTGEGHELTSDRYCFPLGSRDATTDINIELKDKDAKRTALHVLAILKRDIHAKQAQIDAGVLGMHGLEMTITDLDTAICKEKKGLCVVANPAMGTQSSGRPVLVRFMDTSLKCFVPNAAMYDISLVEQQVATQLCIANHKNVKLYAEGAGSARPLSGQQLIPDGGSCSRLIAKLDTDTDFKWTPQMIEGATNEVVQLRSKVKQMLSLTNEDREKLRHLMAKMERAENDLAAINREMKTLRNCVEPFAEDFLLFIDTFSSLPRVHVM